MQNKSLFMVENKSKEMYLFSQNVSKMLFYFIKNKLKVVENVASRKTTIFNMNIWAVHCMNSLVSIPEIQIFTNRFHQSGNFQEAFSFGEKNVKIQNSGFRNSWNRMVSISIVVTKIMIILFEKNGAKKNNTYN